MTSKKKTNTNSSSDTSGGSTTGSSSSGSSSTGSCSSSDSDSSCTRSKTPGPKDSKIPTTVQKSHSKNTESSSKNAKKSKLSETKINHYSSDDDDVDGVNKSSAIISKVVQATKRKSNAKPKTSATITPKLVTKATISKITRGRSSQSKVTVTSKTAPKIKKDDKVDLSKPRSIFSPRHSSESDDNASKLPSSSIKSQAKNSNQKPRTKASLRTVSKTRSADSTKQDPQLFKPKAPETSESSGSSTTTAYNSESEGERNTNLCTSIRGKTQSKLVTKGSHSDSDDEADNKTIRKLTRSSNTRKSIHVLGKNTYSDSDSDSEGSKRSFSNSPVKSTPIVSKGKVKNTKRNETKMRSSDIVIHQERTCPVEDCDSDGHLAGRLEKHFTVEGCPNYHNIPLADCKVSYFERIKRDDIHKKAYESSRKIPRNFSTAEQKHYLSKLREMRSKFKVDGSTIINQPCDKNRQACLRNITHEYDLKLFRAAEAIASEKIEEHLMSLPNCKGTKCIEMGKFEMEVWYQSPYPEDFARVPKLYICEFCLRYMKSYTVLSRHLVKCVWRHPPGEEVYRKDKVSVWEVDGKRYKQYCQNLCLLAKFFLDHKTLYYDVEPFLFYVMTLSDREGCHTVGYFSKEKNSFLNYNVSCILTLPPYQRQGYGRLLIDFSYLLTRVEGKIGSPEKPLSDLGLISYRSYWKDVLLGYLCSRAGTTLSVKDISQEMAIHSYDIVSTLQALGMMKYWKGKHIILKKQDVLDEYVERVKRRGSLLKEVDPECLRWKPFVPPPPVPV